MYFHFQRGIVMKIRNIVLALLGVFTMQTAAFAWHFCLMKAPAW